VSGPTHVARGVAWGVAGVAGVMIGLSACGRDTPAVQGGGRYAQDVAQAIPRVERAVGIRFKRPPRVESRSKADVRAFLERQFATSHAVRDLAGEEAVYKLLGMIPDTMHLRPELENLLTEQIAAYYDPKTKVLYVVDGAPQVELSVIIMHELVHALQDQYINLDSIQSAEGDNDRASAADAIIEGQAVFDQLVAMAGNRNFVAMIPGGWDAMRQQIRQNQASMPALAGAPMALQETLIFPYLSGTEFMRDFDAREPGTQPYGPNMPTSTRQVLHPVDDFLTRRQEPLRVTLPALPRGLQPAYVNDLGEFETRLFLYQHLDDQAAAIRGATGWEGDRYEVVQLPQGPALGWVTVWESAVSAAQFRDLLQQAIARRYGAHPVRSVSIVAAEIGGRPAVVYEDKPAGARTLRMIDPAQVRIEPE